MVKGKNRISIRRNRQNRGMNRTKKASGPLVASNFNAMKININNDQRIPDYTSAPAVARVIRFQVILGAGTPTFAVTPVQLAAQDQTYYGSSSSRYGHVRCDKVMCYMKTVTSTTSAANDDYSLGISDDLGFIAQATPVQGVALASVGMWMNLIQRSTVFAIANTNAFITVSTLPILVTPDTAHITIDAYCVFTP